MLTLGLLTLTVTSGCAGAPAARPQFVPPPPVVRADARPSGASIGLVLTGGGAFGAWEAGALRALFDVWLELYGEDPPLRVVAGTSTGALLAPFALLGREAMIEAGNSYTEVERGDLIAPKLAVLLPFPLFATLSPSVYGAGLPGSRRSGGSRLYRILFESLDAADLARLAEAWPERRVGAATTDFGNGRPHLITNEPSQVDLLRDGVFASAMVPLMLPPVPLPPAGSDPSSAPGDSSRWSPHLDGSVYAVAPLPALFELAAVEPAITLTHVVIIGAFPEFPGWDHGAVQEERFPSKPDFEQIGDRMTALLSEAGVTKDLALTRAALALRRAGVDARTVELETGLRIPGEPPELIALLPGARLGWQALEFRRDEMRAMFERGYRETRRELERHLVEPAQPPRLRPPADVVR